MIDTELLAEIEAHLKYLVAGKYEDPSGGPCAHLNEDDAHNLFSKIVAADARCPDDIRALAARLVAIGEMEFDRWYE